MPGRASRKRPGRVDAALEMQPMRVIVFVLLTPAFRRPNVA
jgi:hypothetical protein